MATQLNLIASRIRSEASRLSAHVEPFEDDYYLEFVKTLHRVSTSPTAPRGLRWHARIALFEMGEE